MKDLTGFLKAVWAEWITLLTGGSIVAVLGLWERLRSPIPPAAYWLVVLAFLVMASFRAWRQERHRATSAESRIFQGRPQVALEYSRVYHQQGTPQVMAHNTSSEAAYNIKLEPLINEDLRAVFDVVPRLNAGESLPVPLTIEGIGAIFARDLLHFLEHAPPKDMSEFVKPAMHTLRARYSDFSGTAFESESHVEFERVPKIARTLQVGGREAARVAM
jgi:hypothetical protein